MPEPQREAALEAVPATRDQNGFQGVERSLVALISRR